jgi:predicted membrane-bound spermidine synthase
VTSILCLIFFASGASALVFETLWFHQAGLALGNGIWASSLVLAGFMAGLALGNALAARFGERMGNPTRTYALFEAAIAVTGVGLVFGLPGLSPWIASVAGDWLDRPVALAALRLGLAFALLLVPSTAMGVTLPLLTRALTGAGEGFGRVIGKLYGWNTLGAVAGVLGTELWLVESLGIRGSACAAGALGAGASVAALALAPRVPQRARPEVPDGSGAGFDRTTLRWWVAAFVSGFGLLALEVVWFRILSLYVLGNALSLAVMLATVLTGIGLGGLAAGAWLRRDPGAHRAAPVVAAAGGVLTILGYALLPWLVDDLGSGLVGGAATIARLGAPLMGPTALLSGVFFTLAGAALREHLASATGTVGSLGFANTLGAALGSLAGGFLLLPWLGMEAGTFAVAALYLIVALLAWGGAATNRELSVAGGIGLVCALVLFPFGSMREHHIVDATERWAPGGSADVVWMRESPISTVMMLDRRELGRHHSFRLVTNGHSMSVDDQRDRRYMKLYVYWPVAVHEHLRDALLIGYGVGSTAKALTDTASLEHIDVVDISKAILESNAVVYPEADAHPLHDPRVDVHIEDGRYFLQASERRYDLITAEPPPPREAGVVNLYTREYFQLIHDRLADGGIATYGLPLHAMNENGALSILAAFCAAFDDCSLWNGNGYDLMMVGTRGAQGPVSADHFAAQWDDPVVGPELRELGFERPEQIGALFIEGADDLRAQTRETPVLSDDWPRRITAQGEFPERIPDEYLAWLDVDAARERFEQSELVARLWPEGLREAARYEFAAQDLINRAGRASRVSLEESIGLLHRILEADELRMPVLWALGSDADIQRVIAEADEAQRARPAAWFHLGAGHLAGRRYDEAARAFARAEGHPAWGREASRLRAYALCRSGRCDEATELARERHARAGSPDRLPAFWAWMRDTFGLDPTAPPRIARAP